jgi:hypothetical protein
VGTELICLNSFDLQDSGRRRNRTVHMLY